MAAHRYWRFLFSASVSDPNYVTAGEIELHSTIGGADQTGSGTASADSEYADWYASKAFANDGVNYTSQCWSSGSGFPHWLKYDFGSGNDKSIVEYSIQTHNSVDYLYYSPSSWEFQYSDNDSDWTTVDTQSGVTGWTLSLVKTFTFDTLYLDGTASIDVSTSGTLTAAITYLVGSASIAVDGSGALVPNRTLLYANGVIATTEGATLSARSLITDHITITITAGSEKKITILFYGNASIEFTVAGNAIPYSLFIDLIVPSPILTAWMGVHAALDVPAPVLFATVTTQRFDVALTMPAPILTAQMGSTVRMSAPAPILTATISNPAVLRFALEVPAPILTATINAGSLMTVALEVPAPILTASMGATVALTVPAPTLTASISSVNMLRVALTVPAPVLTARISTAERLTVVLECPSPILTAWFGATAAMTVPAPILTASISSEAATAETSYAINLATGAVTQLQLGPFDRLVTAHGRLYGLASGALVCLDGAVDGVSTPIAASVRFAPNPWGTGLLKRMECVYVLGRAPTGLLLDVIADETELWRYRLAPVDRVDYGTHKVKVGKGIHFYSVGLALHNEAGGEMDIAGLEPRVTPLSRRVR